MCKNFNYLLSLLLLFISGGLLAQTPEESVKLVYPKLYDKYSKELLATPSCHYFLIDASGSIKEKGLDTSVINALKGYLNGLPDNDFLTIIIFGETLKTKAIGIPNARINGSTRADILNMISNIQFNQQWSDTYSGLAKLTDAMEQAGHEEHQKNVFILTDFLYNSQTNGKNLNKENWGQLRSKISVLKNTSAVNPQAIQLFNGNFAVQSNFVKPKLDEVFGEKIPYESCTNSILIDQKFKDITANILKNKLEGIVLQDAQFEKNNFSLNIKNEKIVLTNANLYSKIELSQEAEELLRDKLQNVPFFSFLPPKRTKISIDGVMIAEAYKYYEGTKQRHEMSHILQDYQFQNKEVQIQLPDSIIPWWLTDIIVLILGILMFRFIWTLLPVSLHGRITFSSPDNFDAATFNANCSGKKTVSVGYGQPIANDPHLLGNEHFSLKISACRKFIKGKCIILEPIKGDIKSKRGNVVIQKNTKSAVAPNSRWAVNGVDIGMPGVK